MVLGLVTTKRGELEEQGRAEAAHRGGEPVRRPRPALPVAAVRLLVDGRGQQRDASTSRSPSCGGSSRSPTRSGVERACSTSRALRVVVTGAASGLGLAMAEVMADGGARVTLADLDADGLEQVAGRLGGDVRTRAARRVRLRRPWSGCSTRWWRSRAGWTSRSPTPGSRSRPGVARRARRARGLRPRQVGHGARREPERRACSRCARRPRAHEGAGQRPHRRDRLDGRLRHRPDGRLLVLGHQGGGDHASSARPRWSWPSTACT